MLQDICGKEMMRVMTSGLPWQRWADMVMEDSDDGVDTVRMTQFF